MLPKPTNTILPANFTCTSCVLITLISFWCALAIWIDFHDARRADAASLPGATQNAQVSVNFLELGVKFLQRSEGRDLTDVALVRWGEKPQGNEEAVALRLLTPPDE